MSSPETRCSFTSSSFSGASIVKSGNALLRYSDFMVRVSKRLIRLVESASKS